MKLKDNNTYVRNMNAQISKKQTGNYDRDYDEKYNKKTNTKDWLRFSATRYFWALSFETNKVRRLKYRSPKYSI